MSAITADDLLRFAKTLCGQFSNRQQAQDQPNHFAHINIFFRPLPWEILQAPGFYSEQSYDHDPWRPYRQGVHALSAGEGVFVVENFGLSNATRLAGAGHHPDLLQELKQQKFQPRCGCAMHFRELSHGRYSGEVEPGKNCLVPRDGAMTYLISEVDVDAQHWVSRDRGFDPNTDALVWGSEHGSLQFERVQSLGEHLTHDWLINRRDER